MNPVAKNLGIKLLGKSVSRLGICFVCTSSIDEKTNELCNNCNLSVIKYPHIVLLCRQTNKDSGNLHSNSFVNVT